VATGNQRGLIMKKYKSIESDPIDIEPLLQKQRVATGNQKGLRMKKHKSIESDPIDM